MATATENGPFEMYSPKNGYFHCHDRQKKSHIWANDSSKQKTLFIAHLVKCGVILPEKTGKYNG